jgi:hypothetical protein
MNLFPNSCHISKILYVFASSLEVKINSLTKFKMPKGREKLTTVDGPKI